jgi:hypothetical protein
VVATIAWVRRDFRGKVRRVATLGMLLSYGVLLLGYFGVFELGYGIYRPNGPPPIYSGHSLSLMFGQFNVAYEDVHIAGPEHEARSLAWTYPLYCEVHLSPMGFLFWPGSVVGFGPFRILEGGRVTTGYMFPAWPFVLTLSIPVLVWIRRHRPRGESRRPGFPVGPVGTDAANE